MKAINNLQTTVKFFGGFGIVILLLLGISSIGILTDLRFSKVLNQFYSDQAIQNKQIEHIKEGILRIQNNQYRYVVNETDRPRISTEIQDSIGVIDGENNEFTQKDLGAKEIARFIEFEQSWKEYKSASNELTSFVDNGNTSAALNSLLSQGRVYIAGDSIMKVIREIEELTQSDMKDVYQTNSITSRNTLILIISLSSLAVFLAGVIAIFITNSIKKPLAQMANSMYLLSMGDQNRNSTTRITEEITDRKDEVGAIGRAFIGISDYMIEMVETANRIATGDLTSNVTPHSNKDELGMAFKEMTNHLKTSIKTISENAVKVNDSSAQLAENANDANQATIADRNHYPAGRPGYCPAVRIGQQDRFLRRTDGSRHRWRCPRRPGTGWSHQ